MKSLPPLSEFFTDLVRSCELMFSENKLLLVTLIALSFVRSAIPVSESTILIRGVAAIGTMMVNIVAQLLLARWFLLNVGAASEDQIRNVKSALVPFALTTVLAGTLVGAATILIVIPGIIFYFAFLVKDYVVLTTKRNYLDALIESRILMDGVKWQTFTYSFAIFAPFFVIQMLINWGLRSVAPDAARIGLLLLQTLITQVLFFIAASFAGNVFVHVRRKLL